MSKILDSLLGVFSSDLAIDFRHGQHLRIYESVSGIALREPSVVAVKKDSRRGTAVLAVGSEAKRMLGRTPATFKPYAPCATGLSPTLK